jgi:hypothetical protein
MMAFAGKQAGSSSSKAARNQSPLDETEKNFTYAHNVSKLPDPISRTRSESVCWPLTRARPANHKAPNWSQLN